MITGAAGNLGRKATSHLSARGYELILLDRVRVDTHSIVADLTSTGWENDFRDVDTVVHLAAHASEHASEEECRQSVQATQTLIEACTAHGVRRIVFSSSTWAMQGYESDSISIREDLPPRPSNAYGRAKAQIEHDLKGFSSAICLRIGWVPPENSKGAALAAPAPLRSIWLSDRDFCHAIERAIMTPGISYAVLNITSCNTGSNWPIDRARETIGYQPSEGISGMDRLRWRLKRRLRKIFNLPR